MKRRIESKNEQTYFDVSDAKSTCFENNSDAASGDSFAESADHAAGHRHVFHDLPES